MPGPSSNWVTGRVPRLLPGLPRPPALARPSVRTGAAGVRGRPLPGGGCGAASVAAWRKARGGPAPSASPAPGCGTHTSNKDKLLLPGALPALLLQAASGRAGPASGRTALRAPASPVLWDKRPAGHDAGRRGLPGEPAPGTVRGKLFTFTGDFLKRRAPLRGLFTTVTPGVPQGLM